MFVPKKNGELKMCVDYRKINAVTVKNKYPLPLMADMRTKLRDARYFTILDLRNAFNLIRVKKKMNGRRHLGQNMGHTNIWSYRSD